MPHNGQDAGAAARQWREQPRAGEAGPETLAALRRAAEKVIAGADAALERALSNDAVAFERAARIHGDP
jgi:hypothetical protein